MYPCVLFALNREARPFYRHFRVRRRLPSAPCPAWLCGRSVGRVPVLETGVGPAASARALDWLAGCSLPGEGFSRPLVVVSAGFAGALQETYHVGDVLIAAEVVDEQGGCWKAGPESVPPCRVLTATRLVGEPAEKRQLGQRFHAAAVDMESACVARFCAERNIPFACVRVISDEVRARLSPRLTALLSGPGVGGGRLLAGLVRSPGMALELWRLARDTRTAARRLAAALLRLLDRQGMPALDGAFFG